VDGVEEFVVPVLLDTIATYDDELMVADESVSLKLLLDMTTMEEDE